MHFLHDGKPDGSPTDEANLALVLVQLKSYFILRARVFRELLLLRRKLLQEKLTGE